MKPMNRKTARLALILLPLALGLVPGAARCQDTPGERRFQPREHLPIESLFYLHIPSGRKLLEGLGETLPGRLMGDPEVRDALGNLPEQVVSLVRMGLGPVVEMLGKDPFEILALLEGEILVTVTGVDPATYVSVVVALELGPRREEIRELMSRVVALLSGGSEPEQVPVGQHSATRILTGGPPVHFLELGDHLILSLSPRVLKVICDAFDGVAAASELHLKDNEDFQEVLARVAVGDPRLQLMLNAGGLRALALTPLMFSPGGQEVARIINLVGLGSFNWLGYSLGAREGDIEGKLYLRTAGDRGILGAIVDGIAPPDLGDDILKWVPASATSVGAYAMNFGEILRTSRDLAVRSLPPEIWSGLEDLVGRFEERTGISLERDVFPLGRADVLLMTVPPPGGGIFDDQLFIARTAVMEPYLETWRKLADAVGDEPLTIPEGDRKIRYLRSGALLSRLGLLEGPLGEFFESTEMPFGTLDTTALSIAMAPLDDTWSVLSSAPQPVIRYLRYHAGGPRLAGDSGLGRRFLEARGANFSFAFQPGRLFLAAYNTVLAMLPSRLDLSEIPGMPLPVRIDFWKLPPGEKFLPHLREGLLTATWDADGIELHGHRVVSGSSGVLLVAAGAVAATAAMVGVRTSTEVEMAVHEADRLECKNKLREIAKYGLIYADSSGKNHFPHSPEGGVASLQLMVDYFGDIKPDVFVCPDSGQDPAVPDARGKYTLNAENCSYEFVPVKLRPTEQQIVAHERLPFHGGGRWVAYTDTLVRFLEEAEFQEALRKLRQDR